MDINKLITDRINGFPIQIDFSCSPALTTIAKRAHEEISKRAKVDRTDLRWRKYSKKYSLEGISAEIGLILLTATDYHRMLRYWWAGTKSGRNCGKDILAYYYAINGFPGPDKDIEVKSTAHAFNKRTGIVYVRAPYGTLDYGDPCPPWEFWEEHLPDSYYCSLEQLKASNPYAFKFHGWATKEMFRNNYYGTHPYNNTALRNTLDPFIPMYNSRQGLPITGLHHSQLNSPESFFAMIRSQT